MPSTVVPMEVKPSQPVHEVEKMNALRMAELAIEVQLEKMHVVEAMNARDAVAQRLADAYGTINEKIAIIEGMKKERKFCQSATSTRSTTPIYDQGGLRVAQDALGIEEIAKSLRDDPTFEGAKFSNSPVVFQTVNDAPPDYDDVKNLSRQQSLESSYHDQAVARAKSVTPLQSRTGTPVIQFYDNASLAYKNISEPQQPEDIAKARNALLASLPLPPEIPDDSLKPIIIPPPFTLHEFLGNASGSLRASLSNYRVFQQLTASWCPDREEHGYLLTPVFKCSTNPRVATAHRWCAVDVLARMSKPIECFYHKDGKWYYAGVYKAFRLQDLTIKEWEGLSPETAQAIIKETIAGRKNTSPQNIYETAQLYAAGALKVACIGLQCVGFNNTVYRAILDLANKCAQSGRWRPNASLGPGGAWNIVANCGVESVGVGERTGHTIAEGSENVPVPEDVQGGAKVKRESGWPDLV